MRSHGLGSHGPELTVVGVGTWAMGGPYRFGWGPVDDEESVAAIRHALAAGVNWVDTAAVYGFGHAEEVAGRAIAPFRGEIHLSTKCGRRPRGGEIVYDLTPASLREECEDSLRRLGLERIDLYQFHWPDLATGTPIEESWAAMAELVREGKVRWAGVSNFDLALLERCEAVMHVDFLQPSLSLLNRHAREELIPWCEWNGTGVVVYSPMGSGLLTGSFNREGLDRLAPDDWRRRAPPFQEPQLSRNLALVDRLEPIAVRLGVGLGALAVAWTLAVPGVTAAIVGARRPAQVDEWLPAAELDLDAETLAEIEQAIEETGAGTTAPPTPPPVAARS